MGYCTTSPRRASSAASAGSPGRTTADDPRHRRTLPPAQLSTHARRLSQHHPALPLDEAGWVGHCTSSLGIPGSIASAGTLLHRHRRPPTAPHPLPPAQRSAHARRLPPHHPELLLSEAGWVGHCTSRPGTAGKHAACCLPPAARRSAHGLAPPDEAPDGTTAARPVCLVTLQGCLQRQRPSGRCWLWREASGWAAGARRKVAPGSTYILLGSGEVYKTNGMQNGADIRPNVSSTDHLGMCRIHEPHVLGTGRLTCCAPPTHKCLAGGPEHQGWGAAPPSLSIQNTSACP